MLFNSVMPQKNQTSPDFFYLNPNIQLPFQIKFLNLFTKFQ